MPTIPLTRTKHLLPFVAFMRNAGEPIGQLLDEARLPGDCIDDPETLIPSDAAFHFRQLAAQTTGLPNIALDVTRALGISDLGDFGQSLLRAPTLARLLDQFCRLSATQTSMAKIELHEQDEGDILLCHHFEFDTDFDLWHNDLYILQWTVKLIRLVDPLWAPLGLWISSSETAERTEAIESLGVSRVSFGHDCTGFSIPKSMLALPLTKRATMERDENSDGASLWPTAPDQTYAGSLRQLIRSYANDRWLGVQQASEVIGTSVRTMQRRLASEGTNFSNVFEGTRSEIAGRLLESTDAAIIDIAMQLGYTSQGNFTRAFRRWSGVAPSAFRKQCKAVAIGGRP